MFAKDEEKNENWVRREAGAHLRAGQKNDIVFLAAIAELGEHDKGCSFCNTRHQSDGR